MKSGYWTREFIVGLFHLITPYWNSEEKKSARLYLAAIITLTIAAVYMTLLLNEWFNSFYSALQNYDSDASQKPFHTVHSDEAPLIACLSLLYDDL